MPHAFRRCRSAAAGLLLLASVLVVVPQSATSLRAETAQAQNATPQLNEPQFAATAGGERPVRSWPVTLGEGRMGLGMSPPALDFRTPVDPGEPETTPRREAQPGTSRRKILWERRADCLDHALQIVIEELAERFGSILVTSTCRTPEHNRRVGGVKNSQHLGGHAVDFYLYGDVRKARAYLRDHRSVGGLGYYGSGRFHVDNGPHRNW